MSWQERLNQIRDPLPLDENAGGSLQFLGWSYQPYLPDNRPHRHTHYEICQIGSYGEGLFHTNGKPHSIGPGDVFIARPGVVHQIVNTAQPLMELRWVSFLWQPPHDGMAGEIARLFKALAQSDVRVAADPSDRLGGLWRTLLTLADGPAQPGFDRQARSMIEALMIAVAQAGAGDLIAPSETPVLNDDAGERLMQTAISYISDNLDRALSVPEIAGHLYCSPRQCTRLFERHVGMSPAAFVAERRLTQAARLLRHSSRAVKEIAADVGIPDISHFTRRFHNRFGHPPAAFRRDTRLLTPEQTIFVPNRQLSD